MKVCLDCNVEKPLWDFYKHSKMQDGHLNKCKSCVKERVKTHREKNIQKIKEYDKQRGMLPHRVKARKEYMQTEQGKIARKKAIISYRKTFPMKYAAHVITGNAIRDKKITKINYCSECNSNKQIQAHHDDYTKPLEIRWLCDLCHKKWHKHNKPIYE